MCTCLELTTLSPIFFSEHAPIALGACGNRIVIAESFARIFFRNCIATGELYPYETTEPLVNSFSTGDEVCNYYCESGWGCCWIGCEDMVFAVLSIVRLGLHINYLCTNSPFLHRACSWSILGNCGSQDWYCEAPFIWQGKQPIIFSLYSCSSCNMMICAFLQVYNLVPLGDARPVINAGGLFPYALKEGMISKSEIA